MSLSLTNKHTLIVSLLSLAVAEMLVKAAKSEGSSDNITVVVVFFKKELSSPKPADFNSKENDPV